MAGISIRHVAEPDVEALLAVFNASRRAVDGFRQGPADAVVLAQAIDGEHVLVAEVAGALVGFASVWAADAFVHHLYIVPERQGQGVGSALLAACEERHGRPLSLKCEVANLRAQRFYARRGWIAGERGDGPDGPWVRLWLNP